MRNDFSAILLMGGKSRRMGRDKAELTLNGKTFLEMQVEKLRSLGISDIMLSGGGKSGEGLRVIKDEATDKGPLGGIASCLKRAENPHCLVISVDTPLIGTDTLSALMASHRSKVTVLAHGEYEEMLIAVFDSDLAPLAESLLEGENISVRALASAAGYEKFRFTGDEKEIFNCNTPEDYEKLL